jgi:hypothetical protein
MQNIETASQHENKRCDHVKKRDQIFTNNPCLVQELSHEREGSAMNQSFIL